MKPYDLIVHNATVVTVNPAFDIIADGAVCIRDGVIDEIRKCGAATELPPAAELLDACGGIVMPGLVNCHTHLPMTLFRGLADDLPLQQWLHEHIFPAEARSISTASVAVGARLGIAEALLSGTTTCCDGYFLEDGVAEAAAEMGIRAVLGQGVIDFPAPGVSDPARNVLHAKTFAAKWHNRSALVTPSIFCHAPYTCSVQTLQQAKGAADEMGLLFQIHAAETQTEVDQCLAAHGVTPIGLLDQAQVLDSRTLLVHAVWINDADIDIIARRRARIAHCPESNMKLGSGVAPVPRLLSAGIAVGLGTDGCASNNNMDLFKEMDAAAKLQKVHCLDPTVMDARSVTVMATVGGAEALGLAKEIGSLEVGKQADLIVIDMQQPHLVPIYHPASHIVYAANGSDVRDVVVAGRIVVQQGKIQTIDTAALLDRAVSLAAGIQGGLHVDA